MKQGRVIFSVFAINLYSQNFTRPNDWKKYRKELVFQGGASGFLGDLGGLNKIGTDFSPVDIEFVLTRPAFTIGYRYKFSKNFNKFSELFIISHKFFHKTFS